jgi:hypothetical protein
MSISTTHQSLFRVPVTADKLSFLQTLFDSSELNADLALALLKVIHSELSNEQTRDRSVYKNYAGTIQSLQFHKSEMLQQIIDAWNAGRVKNDPEWFSDGHIT